MIIADLPPVVSAPAKSCADGKPVYFFLATTKVIPSPDCRWTLYFSGAETSPPKIKGILRRKRQTGDAIVIDNKHGREALRFNMAGNANVHWLHDRRYMLVDYAAGSNVMTPLVFYLSRSSAEPTDISRLIAADILKQVRMDVPTATENDIYHQYVSFVSEDARSLTVSAQVDYETHDDRVGNGSCYLYTVSKATFHHRFVKRLPYDNKNDCPHDPEEHWK